MPGRSHASRLLLWSALSGPLRVAPRPLAGAAGHGISRAPPLCSHRARTAAVSHSRAVALPFAAVRMVTLSPATCYRVESTYGCGRPSRFRWRVLIRRCGFPRLESVAGRRPLLLCSVEKKMGW